MSDCTEERNLCICSSQINTLCVSMQVLLQLASVTADIFSDEQYTAYVMCRTKAAADDFARGLNSIFGLFDIIKGNAHAFKPLFIYSGTSLSL